MTDCLYNVMRCLAIEDPAYYLASIAEDEWLEAVCPLWEYDGVWQTNRTRKRMPKRVSGWRSCETWVEGEKKCPRCGNRPHKNKNTDKHTH